MEIHCWGGGDITISGGESNKICVLEIVTNSDLELEDTGIFSISPIEFNKMVANKYIFFIAMQQFGANTILPTCVSWENITAYCRTTTYYFDLTKNYDTNDITWKVTEKLNIDEKQDMLISGVNIRTINNMPILGSGNITINTGGHGTGVYLTPFTVYDFCVTKYIELTDEQISELCSAAQQNKIICVPYWDSTGYIVAEYIYQLSDVTYDSWSLYLGVIYNGSHYGNSISDYNPNFTPSRMGITHFKPYIEEVLTENGEASVYDDLSYADNKIFLIDGECTELHIYLEPSVIGKTIRFFTGESCALEIPYYVCWANGEVPTIEPYTHYELSLVANSHFEFNAVLTPFKPAE